MSLFCSLDFCRNCGMYIGTWWYNCIKKKSNRSKRKHEKRVLSISIIVMLFFVCYFLLLMAASTAAAAAAAAVLEEFELLLFVVTPWCKRDFASKCSGFVSRLDDTEATECSPDKWLLLGTILSKNFKLSLRKFCKEMKHC